MNNECKYLDIQTSKQTTHKRLYDLFQDNWEAMYAYYILKHTDYPVFLTGKAGTGKSTFIQLAETISETICLKAAPTGIAARNMEGDTIHTLFHLPPQLNLPMDERVQHVRFNQEDGCYLSAADVLIIDEVSMVSSATLDCIDVVLQNVCKNNKPFGGKKVLLVGDPFQLPPVVKSDERHRLKQHYTSEYFFHAKVFQKINPIKIELQEIYRQNEKTFIEVLNDIRSCKNLVKSLSVLNEACVNDTSKRLKSANSNSITLAFTNSVADSINKGELEGLKGDASTYTAKSYGRFDWTSVLAEKILQLKIGARVMFTRNDSKGEYVNGTLGLITELSEDSMVVHSDEGKAITVEREEWETFEYRKQTGKQGHWGYVVVGSMRQYPLKLAWAITVHKSQGLTFDEVSILNNLNSFATGQVYVALSRCRSLQGLKFCKKLKSSDIIVDRLISQFYATIKEDEDRIEALMHGIIDEFEEELLVG
jgi:ATP-dependent exoDNAse (exonuclease V) alpha subunit